MAMNDARVVAEPDLTVVRRARDLLVTALANSPMPSIAELTALAELSDECRTRGSGEPDALTRLLFRTRQLQAERERRIAQVRRRLRG
jgi:hypothetical protein